MIGRCRVNTLISGGTGSGKTTLLNCLTRYIDDDERIITCEDAAELQLQQPHVVRLETRPPNLEGEGQITMRDLVRNCLRMRPERIIVGEVRGPEAFDLLQAMNTGHDGSMGTLHANNPREALSRLESMITMGGFALPSKTIREMICASVDVIIQAARLRDGSRRITHITEVVGMEGDIIITQDLFAMNARRKASGDIIGRHRSTGIGRPRFGSGPAIRRGEAARGRARRCRSHRRAGGTMMTAINPQVLLVALLAAVSIGGIAWVFLYPILSGEKQDGTAAGQRREAKSGRARDRHAQTTEVAARAGRGVDQGARDPQLGRRRRCRFR